MNVIRGLLFDNLGLKFAALLLSVVVYLHVYTDRPASMILSFPLTFTDIPDSLTLAGPVPSAVQAEVRGTGKQLIRMRLTEPMLKLSLSGVQPGHFERQISPTDLPIDAKGGVQVERLLGPLQVQVDVDHKVRRRVPLALRLEGVPAPGYAVVGPVLADPGSLLVVGPHQVVSALDSVAMRPVRIAGRRDSLTEETSPEALPDWCTGEPMLVMVRVPIGRAPESREAPPARTP